MAKLTERQKEALSLVYKSEQCLTVDTRGGEIISCHVGQTMIKPRVVKNLMRKVKFARFGNLRYLKRVGGRVIRRDYWPIYQPQEKVNNV